MRRVASGEKEKQKDSQSYHFCIGSSHHGWIHAFSQSTANSSETQHLLLASTLPFDLIFLIRSFIITILCCSSANVSTVNPQWQGSMAGPSAGPNAGPQSQCKAVCSMQGPYAQCRASAGPCARLMAVCSKDARHRPVRLRPVRLGPIDLGQWPTQANGPLRPIRLRRIRVRPQCGVSACVCVHFCVCGWTALPWTPPQIGAFCF